MRRRRRFWVFVAVAAGAAVVVLGRPGADAGSESPDPPRPADSAPAAAPAERPLPDGAASPPGAGTGSRPAPEPEAPHEASGVVGDEALDPAAAGGALRAAEQFAGIWVAEDPRWYDRLAGLATPALADSLADAEPPVGTGHRVTGGGTVYYDAPEWARVGVPTSRGTLVVDVIVADRHWLVSAVDWRPS